MVNQSTYAAEPSGGSTANPLSVAGAQGLIGHFCYFDAALTEAQIVQDAKHAGLFL